MSGCGQIEPVRVEPINKSYLQLIHNKERGARNIEQLTHSQVLEDYAQKHAEWMASRNRSKHSGVDYDFSYKGENIAYNQRTEDEVTDSWMKSKGHRSNILNPKFTKVGFGCARNKSGSVYWCAFWWEDLAMMMLRPRRYYNYVISLGMMCQVQWYLKMRGLSCPNMSPFQNIVSGRIDAITETLLNPDKQFFSEDQVYIKGVSHSDKTKWIVGSRHLDGVYSTHDFAIDMSLTKKDELDLPALS